MNLSKKAYFLLGGSLLLAVALTVAATTVANRPDPVTVPAETPIRITLNQTLASDQNSSGDRFDATVAEAVVIDAKTVIPEGARVEGLVVEARPSGRLMGRARLHLALRTVEVRGQSYEIRTAASHKVGGDHKKRNLAFIGGGAGGGMLIGAIAGGAKGALIGGPVGAGAGTAVAFFTGKKDIRLGAETPLTFRLAEPVSIDVKG